MFHPLALGFIVVNGRNQWSICLDVVNDMLPMSDVLV
jgi:hypothetical protein